MKKNIIDEINEQYGGFTKSQKLIADFMIENYALVPFETLHDIARRIGLSTTSLIRFARMMGYKDYTDLKKNIQDLIKVKVSLPARFDECVSQDDPRPNDRFIQCREIAFNNIEATMKLQDMEKLDMAIEWICNARHNYILGLRTCFSPAMYLAVVLGQIKKDVSLIQGIAGTYPEEITDVAEGDVCTVFSFPRYYKETVNMAHFIRRRGAKVVIITGKDIRPVKPYGDIIIPCSTQGPSFKDSYVAVFFVIDYIISSIASKNKTEGMEVASKIEEILSQNYFIGF